MTVPPGGADTTSVSTRLRERFDPRPALSRAVTDLPAIAQLTVAAMGAYVFSLFVLGHSAPVLAGTVAVSSLGLVRDARPRRVAETVGGMLLGIVISEILLRLVGPGWWQLGITLAVVVFVARALSPQPGFAIAAAIQGLIVLLFPMAPTEASWSRLADGAVGGVAALLVTALVPRNPRAEVLREARALFAAIDDATATLIRALEDGDRSRAERALEKARALDPLVRAWQESLDSAVAVARISPFLRRRRAELDRYRRVMAATDLAVRNLRVVARRSGYLIDDGVPRPIPADLLRSLARALALVGESLDDIAQQIPAREAARAVARHLDPAQLAPGASAGEHSVISALRPFAVDLLVATGLSEDEARAAMPRI